MTKVLNLFPIFYQIPTEAALQHRERFYSTQKEITEPIADWFYRIRSVIEHCDYGDFGNFLAIDKFFCGLDDAAKQWLRKTKTWSADQLIQAITDPTFLIETTDTDVIAENRLELDELLKIELEDVVSSGKNPMNSFFIKKHLNLIILYANRRVLHHFSIAIRITVI